MNFANLPIMIVQGDIDEAVPVANSGTLVEKERELDYEYVEQPGVTYCPVTESG